MSPRRTGRGHSLAVRATVALVAIGGCAGAAAYAATTPWHGRRPARATVSGAAPSGVSPRRTAAGTAPLPRITGHPQKLATESTARFAFAAGGIAAFQCRLDRGAWGRCRSPLRVSGLGVGEHSFFVRVAGRRRRRPAAAYRWTVVEPKPIAVEPRLSALSSLLPGAPAQEVPVTIRNPNPVPVLVTAVRVTASADPPGCDSDLNFELTPAGVSPLAPLQVPPGGEVSLPAPGMAAPAIALRDLPVDQDACQGAQLPLLFSGEAHG